MMLTPRTIVMTPLLRAAEMQQRALIDASKQQEREVRARQELRNPEFEVKFNQLVEAVASFSKRYNEGKGQVWPLREAEKLREAMRELQSLEKSLKEARSGAPGQNERASTVAPPR